MQISKRDAESRLCQLDGIPSVFPPRLRLQLQLQLMLLYPSSLILRLSFIRSEAKRKKSALAKMNCLALYCRLSAHLKSHGHGRGRGPVIILSCSEMGLFISSVFEQLQEELSDLAVMCSPLSVSLCLIGAPRGSRSLFSVLCSLCPVTNSVFPVSAASVPQFPISMAIH